MSDTKTEEEIHRELIEQCAAEYGVTPDEWVLDTESDRIKAKLGRWRVIVDDEDRGLFTDDTGRLTAEVVGAAEHGNVRVAFYFHSDDFGEDDTSGEEVIPMEDVEPE